MKRIKNLKALGNATINGEYYYFLGKNVEIAPETVEHYGVKNFFEMLGSDKETSYSFIKTDAAGPIPAKQIMNWDEPTFIINNREGKKGEYDVMPLPSYKYK